jgi:hypothetical protein
MAPHSIYVETLIRAPMDSVWAATQDPHEHVRWDVRFSSIVRTNPGEPGTEHFPYSRTVPFHTVHGTGVNIGELRRPDGSRTSALRFWTSDRLSPIRSGRGYWRYVPTPDGIRFYTGYDYEPGWGPLDVVVRPLLGWATAWSFDRMRIWLEGGPQPERWSIFGALNVWQPNRPKAQRCLRAPRGGTRRDDHLAHAPHTLAALPNPKE